MSDIKARRNFYIVVIGRILSIAISLASVRFLTHILDVEEVGFYYILQTIIMLVSFSVLNPIGQYYNRYIYDAYHSGSLTSLSRKLLYLRVVLILSAVLPVSLIFYALSYSVYADYIEFVVTIVFCLLGGTTLVFLEALNVLEKRVYYTLVNLAQLLLGLACSYMLTIYYQPKAIYWLMGPVISQWIFLSFVFLRLKRESDKNIEISDTKFLSFSNYKVVLKFVIPVSIILLLQWVQSSSYRMIFEHIYVVEIVGYVSIGFAVASSIFSAVEGIATQYLGPLFFKGIGNANCDTERGAVWNDYAEKIIPVYVITFFFVTCLGKDLLVLLVDDKFHDAWVFVIGGAVIELFRVMSNALYLVSTSEMNPNKALLPYVCGCVFMIATLLICGSKVTPDLSISFVSFSYMITFCILLLNMKNILKIKMPQGKVFLSIILSVVFFTALFFNVSDNGIFIVFIKVSIFGLLFLLINYFVFICDNEFTFGKWYSNYLQRKK